MALKRMGWGALVTSLMVVLGLGGALHAQGPGGRPPGGPPTAAQELQRLTQALTLTEAQQEAILPILEKRGAAMQALMQNGEGREANQAAMQTIFATSDSEIRALLTEAQVTIYNAMHSSKPPGGGEPPSGGPPQGS